MSGENVLIIYGGIGLLKLSFAHEEPFFTIPLIVAENEKGEHVFGADALEKDETWEVTW
eukprot:CAMPEP_0184048940 /NCGR_PEP_ID=MMETSP0956-20121227/3113_1 /TAXON_ID=627963 /ORGANISM="Aplanochytrium sp, Strain PBS07" /LENGTH=58 /DNA_ID=CAMNT_0026341135 /DNA_START=10 /DNA_END=183 /DNA_ORIENTATION=-